MSWYDAIAFCRWLTEKVKAKVEVKAEGWERLLPSELVSGPGLEDHPADRVAVGKGRARATMAGSFRGALSTSNGYANIDETASLIGTKVGPHYLQKTSAVGMYPQGETIERDAVGNGVADLSGNVWEWCLNEYEKPDSRGESGSADRVLRGGSWYGNDESRRRLVPPQVLPGLSSRQLRFSGGCGVGVPLALCSGTLNSGLWPGGVGAWPPTALRNFVRSRLVVYCVRP